jgi:hypothetical protein
MITNPLGHIGNFIVCFTNIDQVDYFIDHVLIAFLETVRVYRSVAVAAMAPAATTALGATATP